MVWGPQLTGIAACSERCGMGAGVAVAVTVAVTVGVGTAGTTGPPVVNVRPVCPARTPVVSGAGIGAGFAVVPAAGTGADPGAARAAEGLAGGEGWGVTDCMAPRPQPAASSTTVRARPCRVRLPYAFTSLSLPGLIPGLSTHPFGI
jgi:hypothetical protein